MSRKVVGTPPSRAKARESTEVPRRSGKIEITVGGVRVEKSPELEAALFRAYKESLKPFPKEMTTTEAADFLDVSRPFVIKLIKQRELPCRLVGKHRRIPSDALVKHREKMFQQARSAADEMAQASQDMGLCDDAPPKAPLT